MYLTNDQAEALSEMSLKKRVAPLLLFLAGIVGAVLLAMLMGSCAGSNEPDTTAVDYGDAAWEDIQRNKSGRTYYRRHCYLDMVQSWAEGAPNWDYLDCWEANGGQDGDSRYYSTVRHWRDRQVAWETQEAVRQQAQLLENLEERLAEIQALGLDVPDDLLFDLAAELG